MGGSSSLPNGHSEIEGSGKIIRLLRSPDFLKSFAGSRLSNSSNSIKKGSATETGITDIIDGFRDKVNANFHPALNSLKTQVLALPENETCSSFDEVEVSRLENGEFDQLLALVRCRSSVNGVKNYDYIIFTYSTKTQTDELNIYFSKVLAIVGIVAGVALLASNPGLGLTAIAIASDKSVKMYLEAVDNRLNDDKKDKIKAVSMLVLKERGIIYENRGRLVAKF